MAKEKDTKIKIFRQLFEIFKRKDVGKISIFNPFDQNNTEVLTLKDVDEKLRNKEYDKDFWKFIRDFTIAIEDIQSCFSSRTNIYKVSLDLKKFFDTTMDDFMKQNGYCCGKWYNVYAKKITCAGNSKCYVRSGGAYYRFQMWNFCENHFRALPDENIKFSDEIFAKKIEFSYSVHIEEEPEKFVKCKKCNRLFHERCVLHLKMSGIPFFCKKCRNLMPNMIQIKLSSEQIPKTECDEFIERYLREKNVPNFKDIVVRMTSNSTAAFKTKPVISSYRNDPFDEIPYNNCVIFCFFKYPDETEICFFGIYFQLYGSNCCSIPNRNSVYLSYIDSVKLSSMKNRTCTYRHILYGLFEYLKSKNFLKVFIWSCPPKKNEDYIFHEKPAEMKIPTATILCRWYNEFIESALAMDVIESFCCANEYAKKENWSDMSNIPYFEGDIWVARMEDAINDVRKKAKKEPMPKIQINEEIKKFMQHQINYFSGQYFILNLSNRRDGIKAEFPSETRGLWIGDRSLLLDMFGEQKLEYSNERLAKFTTFALIFRIFYEDSICCTCGKCVEIGTNAYHQCIECLHRLNQSPNDIIKSEKLENPNCELMEINEISIEMDNDVIIIEDDPLDDLTPKIYNDRHYLGTVDLTSVEDIKPFIFDSVIDLCE